MSLLRYLRREPWRRKERGKRKDVEAQLDTKGAEMEGAQAKLAVARAKVVRLETESSESQEDALIKASCLQARAEAA